VVVKAGNLYVSCIIQTVSHVSAVYLFNILPNRDEEFLNMDGLFTISSSTQMAPTVARPELARSLPAEAGPNP
jgi:hypothetical protein